MLLLLYCSFVVAAALAFSSCVVSISLVCVSASTHPGPDVVGTTLHALHAIEHEAQAAKLQPFLGRGCPAFHGRCQIHTRLGFNAHKFSLTGRNAETICFMSLIPRIQFFSQKKNNQGCEGYELAFLDPLGITSLPCG